MLFGYMLCKKSPREILTWAGQSGRTSDLENTANKQPKTKNSNAIRMIGKQTHTHMRSSLFDQKFLFFNFLLYTSFFKSSNNFTLSSQNARASFFPIWLMETQTSKWYIILLGKTVIPQPVCPALLRVIHIHVQRYGDWICNYMSALNLITIMYGARAHTTHKIHALPLPLFSNW